jgi:hypothetical protein
MRLVGIDPGKTGAISLFVDGFPTSVVDMPLGVLGIDGAEVFRILRLWEADEAFVEVTHAMPKNGSKAAFSQGDSNGALRTAVGIARIPMTWALPRAWQSHAGLTTSVRMTDIERKRRSRMRAIELFPGMADELARVKDHNRADALLIGRFGVATSIMSAVLDDTHKSGSPI